MKYKVPAYTPMRRIMSDSSGEPTVSEREVTYTDDETTKRQDIHAYVFTLPLAAWPWTHITVDGRYVEIISE